MAAQTLNYFPAEGPLLPDPREPVDQIERVMQLEIALAELRGADPTQVAAAFATSRQDMAPVEREIDVVRLATLQRCVETLGGRHEGHAAFDGAIRVSA